LSSSNAGGAVTFSGTVNVFVTYPSGRSVYADGTTLTATNSSVLPTTSGGTGLNSYATGDLIYASASNTLSKLGISTNGYVLTISAGIPTWTAGGGGASGLNQAQVLKLVSLRL
jgi:hypothetical protein